MDDQGLTDSDFVVGLERIISDALQVMTPEEVFSAVTKVIDRHQNGAREDGGIAAAMI